MNDITRRMLADQAAVCSGTNGLHSALENIFFERDRLVSSDGIVTLITNMPASFGFDGALNGRALSAVLASLKDQEVSINQRGSVVDFTGDDDIFTLPAGSVSRCPVEIDCEWYDWRAELLPQDSDAVFSALSFIVSKTGVDSTFQWSSGITLHCTSSGFFVYSTNNVSLGRSFIPASVPENLQGVAMLVSTSFIKACIRAIQWATPMNFRFSDDSVCLEFAGGTVYGSCIYGKPSVEEYAARVREYPRDASSVIGTEVRRALLAHRALGSDCKTKIICDGGLTATVESRAGDHSARSTARLPEAASGTYYGDNGLMCRSIEMAAWWTVTEDALALFGEKGEMLLLCGLEEDYA